jgi:hypothetical protein
VVAAAVASRVNNSSICLQATIKKQEPIIEKSISDTLQGIRSYCKAIKRFLNARSEWVLIL